MNFTQTILGKNLAYTPGNQPQIEICFGGVSPLGPCNGLTTCYGIYIPRTHTDHSVGIIVDNGTGIHYVLKFMDMRKPEKMILLQTHLHLDHLIGLRFNTYLFEGKTSTYCLIPDYLLKDMKGIVSPPFHPVDMRPLKRAIDGKPFKKYGVTITTHDLPHGKVLTTGFRIEAIGKVIVVATDCELREYEDQISFASWSKGANMIILDMQYADEKAYREGHGHNHPGLIRQTLEYWNTGNTSGAKAHLVLVHRDAPPVPHDFNRSLLTPGMEIATSNAVNQISIPNDGDIIFL